MRRTYVVTGAASGIGLATAELLTTRGHKVIGVDLHDTDVTADLSTPAGRTRLVEQTRQLSGGSIDAVIAVAGVSAMSPITASVNYFGALATLEGLRPLLEGSPAPRAVAVTSMVSLYPVDDLLVASLTVGDESAARDRAAELVLTEAGGALLYPSTKKALAQWVRRSAPSEAWAGAGIPLNAIAPGVIVTPMSAAMLETEEGRESIRAGVPMPLNGFADAVVPARLLAWLADEENTHLCGQVIFIDGGSDAVTRGDSVW